MVKILSSNYKQSIMYDYIALKINVNPCNEDITDLLAAFLADVEFESFEPDESGLIAYVRKDKYNREEVEQIMKDFPMKVNLSTSETEIQGEDWNKEWEQNYFRPIHIDKKLTIRSSFHDNSQSAPIEIIIDPKMAFGTGHHATTAGMSRMLLNANLKGKTVIDMGTGTGILAILAKKLGAGNTVGIDIDKFAIENAVENGIRNNVDIQWISSDDKTLNELENVDVFLANINLNVIKENLEKYSSKLRSGGLIFLSGFLDSDRDTILVEAKKNGLKFVKESEENHWMTMEFERP